MSNVSMFLFNDDEEMKPKPSEIKRLQEGSVKCIEKKKEPYVEGMIFVLQMDREIDKDKHCIISPGGYEFKSSKSEKSLQFDFFDYAGYIDSNDKTKILFETEVLDRQSFPGTIDKLNKSFCEDINEITEFYVYTGEDEDPELNLSKIIDISLLFTDGTKIDIKEEVINKYNEKITKTKEKKKMPMINRLSSMSSTLKSSPVLPVKPP